MFVFTNPNNLADSHRFEEEMYAALYRRLPGNRFLKWLQLLLLAVSVIILLIFVAFPIIESLISEDPSLNG
jgi:hypothetical protein